MTLVIMAAGMGSRFGGLKQIEPVGQNGEFIIDYSIYDAIKAGFKKVIIIIKRENKEIFEETIGNRIRGKIDLEYVFQENSILPEGVEVPSDRVKPLGTAHALYCAIDKIDGPFAVISADDFYGREPFYLLRDSLNKNEYSVIGYKIGNTLTENGSVKRGVCFTENNYLSSLIESKVERIDGVITAEPLEGGDKYTLEEDHPVSMLMFGIQKEFTDFIKEDIVRFFKENASDLSKCEYLLPTALDDYMKKTQQKMIVYPTSAVWMGVTYKEDKDKLVDAINKLIKEGEYPSELYPKTKKLSK